MGLRAPGLIPRWPLAMRIDERAVGEITILTVHNRMTQNDGHGAVKDRVGELLGAGCRQLVLDLGHVPYMDSTCVGELVSAFLTTRSQGGTLKFAGVSGRVATLFTISKLDTVFEVFETDTAALQSFSGA